MLIPTHSTGRENLCHIKFVDHQSASIHGKRTIYLSTDHSGLNKFHGAEDENFLLVRPEIQRMFQIASRRIEESNHCTIYRLYTLELMFLKATLTSLKHTRWVPKIHEDKKMANTK